MRQLLYFAVALCALISTARADYWATTAGNSATYSAPIGTKADGPPVDASPSGSVKRCPVTVKPGVVAIFSCKLVKEPVPAPEPTPAPTPVPPPPAPVPTPGACSSSFADVTLPLCDGTYSASVGASTFPAGSVIQAQHPGAVIFTGSFSTGPNLTFRGIVVKGSSEKSLGAGSTFEDMSFVGGPACGNNVNTLAAKDVTVRRSAFYGSGGRYLLLAYQVSGVRLEDVIFRPEGGWGSGTGCSGFEPNAALNFYDSDNVACVGCVLFDGLKFGSESEHLGGLGVNCHQSHIGMLFERSVIVNSPRGFYADGMGTCAGVTVRQSVAVGGDYASNRNVGGRTDLVNVTLSGNCGNWKGSTVAADSKVSGAMSGCSGVKTGKGATAALNTAFLDDPRWRRELCAGATRGWCGTTQKLSEYIKAFVE